ncbi:hypothetical protein pb186bvf_019124 [Paramecium bursaria]
MFWSFRLSAIKTKSLTHSFILQINSLNKFYRKKNREYYIKSYILFGLQQKGSLWIHFNEEKMFYSYMFLNKNKYLYMRFQIMREQNNKYQLISKIMQISISLLITRKQVYPSFF